MESCYCYCCGDELFSGEKKKRRRPLSSADLQRTLQTLIDIIAKQQQSVDMSKLHTGYICRSCAGVLDRYASLYQQISGKIKNARPILPPRADAPAAGQVELESTTGTTQTLSATPRVEYDTTAVPVTSNESPPLVVCFI